MRYNSVADNMGLSSFV